MMGRPIVIDLSYDVDSSRKMSGSVPGKPRNVLYLCTGNSARSILAEAITNRLGRGRFRGFSAGARPKGDVHPQTLELLIDLGYETAQLHSKGYDAFTGPAAPIMDTVITVCDAAAGESCPIWPGHPATGHWSIPDPISGSPRQIRAALVKAYEMLEQRVAALVALSHDQLSDAELRSRLTDIGRSGRTLLLYGL
jgi:arsenate reductase